MCVSRHEFIFVMFVASGPCRIFLAEPSAYYSGSGRQNVRWVVTIPNRLFKFTFSDKA